MIESHDLPIRSGLSRRDFVKKSIWGATASLAIPSFIENTLFQLDANAQSNPSNGNEGPILIIFEQVGGNDSLNTVIPFRNDIYRDARPKLRIGDEHGVFDIGHCPSTSGTEEVAFHPALANLYKAWSEGDVAVINGIGYPNPSLSHFASFDYYHSAMPGSGTASTGWIGRYFDYQCDGCGNLMGVDFSGTPSRSSLSEEGYYQTMTMRNTREIKWHEFSTLGKDPSLHSLYKKLIGLGSQQGDGISETDDILAYVQKSSHNAMITIEQVEQAAEFLDQIQYEHWHQSGLANQLKDIATMIGSNMSPSVYYVHQNGYDTHGSQIINGSPLEGGHYNLLHDLDRSINSFREEAILQGFWDRTIILTISEFGRKLIENGAAGTDHGVGQTLFAIGGGVNGGFYGELQDLASQSRIYRNSLNYTTDFRSVYRTVLENWLQVPESIISSILPSQPADFSKLDFV